MLLQLFIFLAAHSDTQCKTRAEKIDWFGGSQPWGRETGFAIRERAWENTIVLRTPVKNSERDSYNGNNSVQAAPFL